VKTDKDAKDFSIIIVTYIEHDTVYYKNFTFNVKPTFSIFIIAYVLCIVYLKKEDCLKLDRLLDADNNPRKRLAMMGIYDFYLKEKKFPVEMENIYLGGKM